jgi:hypothetical protein
LKKELEKIKERNRRVELDKAWETSKARKLIIAILTYVVILVFLIFIQAPNPYLSALIPTAGFFLSTLTMPMFKRMWIEHYQKKN